MPDSDTEPRLDTPDPSAQFVAYLDHYRATVARTTGGLTEARLRTSLVPSGWSPLELLSHLVHMERRWFVWGFLGEPVEEPWGDHEGGVKGGRWAVPEGVTADGLIARLHAGGDRTRTILAAHPLDARGAVGGRFTTAPAPTLSWIAFHVLQEYARHAGHLDIVRELADGPAGP
ncbi:DinB family protein [Streptomyces abyssomicinicus]|uniref:DinB family protein n=1 Tax=Streptomyces abyssomicinicus TaxID=574929 RepID=UPI0012507EE3|nr:DinB family protein [Streptomyces abyssomicinicus]